MKREIMSQWKQSTKSKRISVKHFFSNEIIKKRSNSHIPIGEAYMHRRHPEVHLSQANLVCLQNAWIPLGQFSGNCGLFCLLFGDNYVQSILFPVGRSAQQPFRC